MVADFGEPQRAQEPPPSVAAVGGCNCRASKEMHGNGQRRRQTYEPFLLLAVVAALLLLAVSIGLGDETDGLSLGERNHIISSCYFYILIQHS